MLTNEEMIRYLTAYRAAVAHLSRESEAAVRTWAAANVAEGQSRFKAAYDARLSRSPEAVAAARVDGLDEVEAAYLAIKVWAQGTHYMDPGTPL